MFENRFDDTPFELQAKLKDSIPPELADIPFYESHDPAIFDSSRIKPSSGSTLFVFKDNMTVPLSTLDFPASSHELKTFLLSHKHAIVTQLDSENFDEIMKSPTRALVVLVALKTDKENVLKQEVEKLKMISRAWMRGGRGFVQPVWFVWVDGVKYAKWLKQSYG